MSFHMKSTLLLVEDDALSAEFMSMFLEGEGFAVTVASSYREALTVISSLHPAVLITDLCLGDGSGANLAHVARADGTKLIIGVSGLDPSGIAELKIDTSAFSRILTKPVDFDILGGSIRGE